MSNEDWATVEQYGWREGRIYAFGQSGNFFDELPRYLADCDAARKERLVLYRPQTLYRKSEELALAAQAELSTSIFRFARSTANDVFVDVNKHIGLQALMKHLKVEGSQPDT